WLWDSLFDRAVVLSDLVTTGGEDDVLELKYASQLLMLTAIHAAGSGGEEQLQRHMFIPMLELAKVCIWGVAKPPPEVLQFIGNTLTAAGNAFCYRAMEN